MELTSSLIALSCFAVLVVIYTTGRIIYDGWQFKRSRKYAEKLYQEYSPYM